MLSKVSSKSVTSRRSKDPNSVHCSKIVCRMLTCAVREDLERHAAHSLSIKISKCVRSSRSSWRFAPTPSSFFYGADSSCKFDHLTGEIPHLPPRDGYVRLGLTFLCAHATNASIILATFWIRLILPQRMRSTSF